MHQTPRTDLSLEDEIRAARTRAVLSDLGQHDVLLLESPDVRRWANGMFTNNIQRLRPGQGNRNAMCDDRGRIQGLLDLYCIDDQHFLAVLDGVDAGWFEERYRMFLVLDDIEVEVRPDGATVIGVQGPEAGRILHALGLPAPEADHAHALEGSVRVCRKDRSGVGGFDLILPATDVPGLWQRLEEAGAIAISAEAQEALRILAGRARYPQDATDRTFVHDLRLEGEVCAFDKGCYVGQEVINRIDVRGVFQRRLMGLLVDGVNTPPPGSEVRLDGSPIGSISSAVSLGGRTYAIGVLRKAAWEPGTRVSVAMPDGEAEATVQALPFEPVAS